MISLPTLDSLDAVTVPTPCTVPWDEMHGTDRTRFCAQCNQNVHDVSELTRAEALELLTAGDKAPCVRIFKRPDGRAMTADCATRRERVWKWLDRRSKWAGALFALVFFAGCEGRTAGKPCVVGEPVKARPASVDAIEGADAIARGVAAEGKRHR